MRTRIIAPLALLVVLPLGAAAGSAPAVSPTAAAPVSPSQVLRKLATDGASRSGMMYVQAGPRDGVDGGDDRTLAPYLYVAGGNPDTERLPLRETSARIDVAGVIAHVGVRQVFENGGQKPIEAVYVFPASTRAAVHGMRMKIGQRVIEAHIDRKQAAREDYEAARAEGRHASLLEQQRPNVFTMNVANLMPGDRVEVALDYSEMLVPEDAVYELVYPTVVGPRYAGGADPAKDGWMANPHLPAGTPAPYKFDLGVHLETGVGLKAVSSPSHAIDVSYASPSSADVKLREAGAGGDRDFVLRYRLAGDKIETGLLLGPRQADGDGYFALMMEPPQSPAPNQIPPREYIFLLDVSGSMHGFPLDTAKALMRKLLGQLRPTDLFDVALFSGANYVMSPGGSVVASRANVAAAVELVEKQTGGGGTELMGGLQASYGIPRHNQNVSRTVVVVTDGYVGVEAQAFRFIRERLGEANLFAFGIGTSVNRALIEGMARAGQGEPFVVLRPEKAAAEAEKLRLTIEQPVLTRIAVTFDGFSTAEVSPAKVPDLMARRPLVLFGKYHGEPGGQIKVAGLGGGGAPFSRVVEVRRGGDSARNEALRWLWARSWVATLDDELHMGGGKVVEEAITDLGLRHSLLTSFTSFVAVDRQQVVNGNGQSTTVRQPLPMPAGVPNSAVGEVASVGGGVGYGMGGGGSLAKRAYKSAPSPAAPPAQARAQAEAREERDEKAADKDDRRHRSVALPVLSVRGTTASGLGDVAALRAAFDARLAAVRAGCPVRAGQVVLRLTVDATGKVVAVDTVSGDAAVAAYLRAKLVGLTSGTRATGKIGTWTVAVSISPSP